MFPGLPKGKVPGQEDVPATRLWYSGLVCAGARRILVPHPPPLTKSQPAPPGPTFGGPRMTLRVTAGCRVHARPRHRLLFLVWEPGSSVHKPAVPPTSSPLHVRSSPSPHPHTPDHHISPFPCPLSRLPGLLSAAESEVPGPSHTEAQNTQVSSTVVAPALPTTSPAEETASWTVEWGA